MELNVFMYTRPSFLPAAAVRYQVLEKIKEEIFDIIILDISMPGPSGIEIMQQLKTEGITTPILILSVYPEDQYAVRVIKAGAGGYLTKEAASTELIKAVRTIAAGEKYISPSLAIRLAEYIGKPDHEKSHTRLSNREYSVFHLIVSGKTIKEISNTLNLGVSTISTYRSRILKKMNMHTNSELTHYAFKNNLIK